MGPGSLYWSCLLGTLNCSRNDPQLFSKRLLKRSRNDPQLFSKRLLKRSRNDPQLFSKRLLWFRYGSGVLIAYKWWAFVLLHDQNLPMKLIYAYGQTDEIKYHSTQRGTKELNLLKYMPRVNPPNSKYFDMTMINVRNRELPIHSLRL